jgi:hypothetical protein
MSPLAQILVGLEPLGIKSNFTMYQLAPKKLIIGRMLDDAQQQSMCMRFFENLAAVRPNEVHPYEDRLVAIMRSDDVIGGQVSRVMVKLATDAVRR